MQFLQELREGQKVSSVYLCKSKASGTTKAGKTYYNLSLQDKTTSLAGKVWELTNAIEHFEAGDAIKIEGDVTSFNGELQIRVTRIRRASEGEYNLSDLLPTSPYDIERMYQQLLDKIASLKNPKIKRLLNSFFLDDAEFARSFKYHSAAKAMHHGFVGGLLQHTLGVASICESYCKLYNYLNRDLLIAAALLHDIGKVRELSEFPTNDYTDEGQLLGHIVIGYEMVSRHIDEIEGFPQKTADELKHCILAHHGELEYGSPKKPALAEAVALNMADNSDAKLEMMLEGLGDSNGEWVGFNRGLDSNIRKTTPLPQG